MKIDKSKILVILLFLVLIIGLSSFWLLRNQENSNSNGELSFYYNWKVRQKYNYNFKYTNSSNADFTQLFNEQKVTQATVEKYSLKVIWEGDYTISVVESNGEKFVLKNELSLKSFQFYSPDNPIFIASDKVGIMRRELILPFYTEVDSKGTIKQIRFQSNLDRNTIQLLKNFIALTQVQFRPFMKEKAEWQTFENDLQGVYSANYSSNNANDDLVTITKTKKNYEKNRDSKNGRKSVGELEIAKKVIPNSNWSIIFDSANCRLQELNGSDQIVTEVNGHKLAENFSEISLKFMQLGEMEFNQIQMDQSTLATNMHTALPYQSLSQNLENGEMENLMQKQELGSLTAQELIQLLKKYYKENDEKNLEKLYLKLKALIYLEPISANELLSLLREFPANSLAHNLLLRVLGSVGNEVAQTTLISALKEASDDKKLVNTILEIGTLKNPNEAAQRALLDIINNGKNELTISSAGLALGIMAGTLSQINPEREKNIIEPMVNDYQNASTNAQKVYLLSVFGNSGSIYAENRVIDALKDPAIEVRSEALKSLRFFKGDSISDLLIDHLQDPNSDIRAATIFALAFKNPTKAIYEAQKNQFLMEQNGENRRELFKNLWELKSFEPSVKDFLKDQRSGEKDAEFAKMMDSYFLSASEN
ncbi:MAG: HEAT repeat domain-containing protein [Bacteriovoracaceae bacterium]